MSAANGGNLRNNKNRRKNYALQKPGDIILVSVGFQAAILAELHKLKNVGVNYEIGRMSCPLASQIREFGGFRARSEAIAELAGALICCVNSNIQVKGRRFRARSEAILGERFPQNVVRVVDLFSEVS